MYPYETPEIQKKLDIVKESVLAIVPNTEAMYLFGSYAYGNPHKDSDLDICVIVPDSVSKRELDIAMEIRGDFYDKLDHSADLFVKKSAIFADRKDGPTLERVISKKGVRLYGK
ncbi:MAG: nucleotidyltransferase domain-containing protein [Oscillospiraceae bacterium]|jgi:predicted nucleotidyltransferase|nr:nucleotidyltransferase domain-containing protein [Oscillospiraceae bacterium]